MKERSTHRIGFRKVIDHITVVIIGVPLGLLFLILIALGRVRIRGYIRALRLVARGNVIIASNHPSMLETFLVPLSFFPFNLVLLRFFVWSVPDRRLLPPRLRGLFSLMRCITVDRSEPDKNKYTLQKLTHVLLAGGVVVIHPEAGRTGKGTAFICKNNRCVREFVSSVPALARRTDATILPLWVEGASAVLPIGTAIPHFFRAKVILSFGVPYKPQGKELNRQKESLVLAKAILDS